MPIPEIKRTANEIDELWSWANEGQSEGTRYSGMSYEDGIDATLAWLTGQTDERPDSD
jgi:hypothetical protein